MKSTIADRDALLAAPYLTPVAKAALAGWDQGAFVKRLKEGPAVTVPISCPPRGKLRRARLARLNRAYSFLKENSR